MNIISMGYADMLTMLYVFVKLYINFKYPFSIDNNIDYILLGLLFIVNSKNVQSTKACSMFSLLLLLFA